MYLSALSHQLRSESSTARPRSSLLSCLSCPVALDLSCLQTPLPSAVFLVLSRRFPCSSQSYPDTFNSSCLSPSHGREGVLCHPVGRTPSPALWILPLLRFLQGFGIQSWVCETRTRGKGTVCSYMFGGLQHPAECLAHNRCPVDTNGGSEGGRVSEWEFFSLMANHRRSA